MAAQTSLSRRDLLKATGALLVSFSLRAQNNADPPKPLDPSEVDSFLAVHPDGSVTVYTGKVDIGQGLRIAVRQMAAEELGIPVERIRLVEGDTGLSPDQGGTGGSTGLTRGGSEVRQAAATARRALINLGAEKLQARAADLTILDGVVRPTAGGPGVTIAGLVGGRKLDLKVDPKAPLQEPASYQTVGKPLARPDVPGKCTAKGDYIQDLTLPGMFHGRVVRPPAVGAKLVSVDESSIRTIPDVRVVRIENFLGVVAPDEWAAVRAARELKAAWSEGQGLPGNDGLERYLRESPVDHDQVIVGKPRGDAKITPAPVRQLSSTYFWPNQSHGSLGPSCAVADWRPDGLTVWTSSQSTHGQRASFAKIFGLAETKVRVIYKEGAGSYGGNGNDDAAADAVLLSRAVGRPVRVQWMRHDEHGWDPKGPQQLLELRAGLDNHGRIAFWDTQMWLPAALPGNRPFLGIDAAGLAQPHGQNAGQISQNGDPSYEVLNPLVTVHWLKQTPLRISNLRAPGKIANVFAVESFTDELAAAIGTDPIAFRMHGITDPRATAVVKRAAEMIGWQARPSPNPKAAEGALLVGRGFAYMRYKQSENYVAMAMEVAVERNTGKIAVRRVVCAHDCGLVVNPDALRNQIEGSIVQTLSRTLHEEVKFDRSRVTSLDWSSYPILRFPEAPAIEVALLDHPELPLYGAGEASTAPVAAALGNSVFDATGVRLRTVPFTPERVKAALA
jgi:CO/xanthine dehydrogenase Mo-binding subunit